MLRNVLGPPKADIRCAVESNAAVSMAQFESQCPSWQERVVWARHLPEPVKLIVRVHRPAIIKIG